MFSELFPVFQRVERFKKKELLYYFITGRIVILGGMLPAAIGGILLVTLISLLSCLRPAGWVMKQNITEAIASVRY